MEFLIILVKEILRNKILVITLTVWALAQCIKVFLGVIRERRFNFRWFIGTGGMPSSHAAGATALATTIGMERGFDSVIFALSAVFALVTMFDAQGVRRATGQQAEILNRILEDIYWRGKIETNRLVELIGHTPIQVFIGSIIGCLMSIIFYSMWGR
ncbi:MAG TPA: divergent PAP2 family protein [Candidatus Omnitrophota bacterium]|nr:divergent PAP2 family protein [Candidatus Omnitrophota bacterium]HPB68548.1 divergent PAP2 family protein [Candidatus Omnitrophota bacterium]HQO57812.1 divergent PAP2 family protein [Candidatus Omnitrophota bacterium]HQP12117.1 divergent PAP2 family protein [Candidatus Omnitrophota bacterium]